MQQHIADLKEEATSKIPALTLLTTIGYQYITPTASNKLRTDNKSVILTEVLRQKLQAKTFSIKGNNCKLSAANIDKLLYKFAHPLMQTGLVAGNEKIHEDLTYGITVVEFINGNRENITVSLIDWHNPENNSYHVTEEFTVTNKNNKVTPDIVCFVNGLPFVVIEAKRPSGKSPIKDAISQQIRNQKPEFIPQLFVYSQILCAIDGFNAKYATCGTTEKFWSIWREQQITVAKFRQLKNAKIKTKQLQDIFSSRSSKQLAEYNDKKAAGLAVTEQDKLIISLLKPERLLEFTKKFIIFHQKYGKIIARPHQYFGVKAAIKRISNIKDTGAREGGVIWHTTGSGKSLSMVFLVASLLYAKGELAQARIVVVTDRIDLENQLFNTFNKTGAISAKRSADAKANSGTQLAHKIINSNERLVFAIINKFASAIKQAKCDNNSNNIIVLVDEAHRSQYGDNNFDMQKMLPNASFIGFTGTPLTEEEKTEQKFGSIIHAYTMQQAEQDGIVTPLRYERRLANLAANSEAIDQEFNRFTEKFTEKQRNDLKRKFAKSGSINELEERLELIAYDISDHLLSITNKNKKDRLKAMLACSSKKAAIRYHKMLTKIGKITSKVVISAPDKREGYDNIKEETSSEVLAWWQQNVGNTEERKYTNATIDEFQQDNGFDLIIVVDKLLTGFDEPKNTVLYIDKLLKQHSLLQAIARVNRIHKNKKYGILIDYKGVLEELDTTITKYQDLAKKTQNGYEIKDLAGLYSHISNEYKKLPRLYDELLAVFNEVANKQDFVALRQFLSPDINPQTLQDNNQKKREDFYQKLIAFSNCLKTAWQSKSYYEDKSFDNIRQCYKDTLKMMFALRQQVKADANETIDYDAYAIDIEAMLNKHVEATTIQAGTQTYVSDLGNKNIDADKLSDADAIGGAGTIISRTTKNLENLATTDPYAHKKFSALVEEAIAKASKDNCTPQQKYKIFAQLEDKINNDLPEGIPFELIANITNSKVKQRLQAYYGLFIAELDQSIIMHKQNLTKQQCCDYAHKFETIIEDAIKVNSLSNDDIEKQIKTNLLNLLHEKIAIATVEILIDQVIKIVRVRLDSGV